MFKKKKEIDKLYLASLPERSIRFLTSGVTSITSLFTKLFLPDFIKESSMYKVSFGMLQNFLITKIAQVQFNDESFKTPDNYVIKKTAGSLIEGIGLVSIKFSPIWLLAITSDLAGGSNVYLKYLVEEMKSQELIDNDKNYSNIYDLLDGIQYSTKKGVEVMDMPPINKKEVSLLINEIKSIYEKNPNETKKLLSNLEMIWKKMQEISKSNNISINSLSGGMAIDLMTKAAKKSFIFSIISTKVNFNIFKKYILKSYQNSLNEVTTIGGLTYLKRHMTPFIHQLKIHFNKDKLSLTEKIIKKAKKILKF